MLHQSLSLLVILRTEQVQLWTICLALYSCQAKEKMRHCIGHKRLILCLLYSNHYVRMPLGIFFRAIEPHWYLVFLLGYILRDVGGVVSPTMMQRTRTIDFITVVWEIDDYSIIILEPINDSTYNRVIIPHSTIVECYVPLLLLSVLRTIIIFREELHLLFWASYAVVHMLSHEVEDGE